MPSPRADRRSRPRRATDGGRAARRLRPRAARRRAGRADRLGAHLRRRPRRGGRRPTGTPSTGRGGRRSSTGPRTSTSTTGPSRSSGRAASRRASRPSRAEPLRVTLAVDAEDDAADDAGDDALEPSDDPTITLRFSAVEVLRHKDFAAYTDERARRGHRLMADLRLAGALRPSRRLVQSDARPRPPRPAPHGAPRPAGRRRADAAPSPGARRPAPPAGAAGRRLGLDGALRPGAAPLRPRRRGRPANGSRPSPSAPA